jgi:hypothetical protein
LTMPNDGKIFSVVINIDFFGYWWYVSYIIIATLKWGGKPRQIYIKLTSETLDLDSLTH